MRITDKYIVRIPGYFIEANIDFPEYNPHAIWWLAYVSELLEGRTIEQIEKNPPWPIPNNKLITRQILKELIDQGWLIPNWTKSEFRIIPKITEMYKKRGETALAQEFLKYSTERGQWWVDALSGTPLSVQKAIQYDYDFNRPKPKNLIKLKPQLTVENLIENLNIDIKTLIKLFKPVEINDFFKYSRAFLSSPFNLSGKKDIEFEMFGSFKGEHQRIIPQDLAILEPMLWEFAPEIFGKKPKRRKKLFFWTKSIVEKFALLLEKFPNYISLITSKHYFQYIVERLQELIGRKEEWINWYNSSIDLLPLADVSELFFDVLSEICEGSLKINKKTPKSSPKKIILYTSFLNVNHLYADFGLVNSLKNTPSEAEILLIYGHANDDPPEEQKEDISEYYSKIVQLAPNLKNRLKVISSVKRSHEKIILSSNGDWLISSWNPGSSNPDSQLFEAGIYGRSARFSLEVLKKVEENLEGQEIIEYLRSFKETLNSKIEIDSDLQKLAKFYYSRLNQSLLSFISLLQGSTEFMEIQQKYERSLCKVRICLLPFLKRSKVKLVNEHQSRDVLITQIKSSKDEIFIASDRVAKTALDRTLLNDIVGGGNENERFLRILWGREWETKRKLSPGIRNQLKDARNAIKMAQSILGNRLKTSLYPMENHAKFALFDGCRGLISSENLLSYGGEKGIYESRELGIFIESLPVVRHIQGWATFHRLNQLHPDRTVSEMGYRPYEWIVFGSDCYFSFEMIKDKLNFDFSNLSYIQGAIEDYLINPNPREFDDFDAKLIQERLACYLERNELVQDSFIEYLWKEGMRYYLLKPTLDKNWIPYIEPIMKEEIQEITILEIENLGKPIQTQLKKKMEKNDYLDIAQKEDPIIKEIMNNMVLIKAGSFMMGDNEIFYDKPVHKVEITQDFYMGKYIVTQRLWEKIMGKLPIIPPKQRSPNFPVFYISYYDVQEFIKKLNILSGSGYFDLPTDAQWEYACRAGSKGKYCFGDNHKLLDQYAWSQINSDRRIHDVGLLKSNDWGLYDMHGLMYELVKDDIRKFTKTSVKDPVGPLTTDMGLARGGSWGKYPFPKNIKNQFFRCGRRSPNAKIEKSHRLSFRLIRKTRKQV